MGHSLFNRQKQSMNAVAYLAMDVGIYDCFDLLMEITSGFPAVLEPLIQISMSMDKCDFKEVCEALIAMEIRGKILLTRLRVTSVNELLEHLYLSGLLTNKLHLSYESSQ